MTQMTRREALELCALSLLATQIGCSPPVELDDASKHKLLSYGSSLTHLESCKVVGHDWLETQSQSFDPRKAYEDLFVSLKDKTDLKSRLVALRRRQKEDFEAGRTLKLGGWLMSETELKVYALMATL